LYSDYSLIVLFSNINRSSVGVENYSYCYFSLLRINGIDPLVIVDEKSFILVTSSINRPKAAAAAAAYVPSSL